MNRREMLGNLAAAGLASLDGGAAPGARVVVVGAHPDDPESGAGGTAKLLAAAGHAVTFLYLTRGEAGIAGAGAAVAGRRREEEARAACRVLGVAPVFVGQVDNATQLDAASRDAFRALLQKLKPELVLTHWPLDTSRDHRACAELVFDVWAQKRNAFSLLFFEVLSGYQTQTFAPDVYVDIGPSVEAKRDALACHQSQGAAVWEHHQRMQGYRGLETHATAAEAFVHHRPSPTTSLLVPFAPRPK
jgi:N-acetylglucosamine malate deacetylase 1